MHCPGGWKGLGGASKKESSREDILQQAKADRAARGEARKRSKAATTIQAYWRSHQSRATFRKQLLHEWHSRFAVIAGAGAGGEQLSANEVAEAVRVLVMAVLPLGSSITRQLLSSGDPSTWMGHGNKARNATSTSTPAAIRGTLALLMRHKHAPVDQEQQSTWLPQAVQLCQLCCLGVAPPSAESDPVLDAAATRLLQLMTSQQYWAPHQDGNDVERGSRNSSSAAAVLHGIMVQPMPLLQATRRMVTNGSVAGQPQAAAAAQLTPAAVTASGVQRLMEIVAKLLESCSKPYNKVQHHCVAQTLLVVFTTPGLVSALPAASKMQLATRHVLRDVLLPEARELAQAGSLSGLAAVHCFTNLVKLLTHCGPGPGHPHQQQQQASLNIPPCCLSDSAVAAEYCATAVKLLSAATRFPSGKHRQGGHTGTSSLQRAGAKGSSVQQLQEVDSASAAAAVLNHECCVLGTQQHLLELKQVLTSSFSDGMVIWCAYCAHLIQDCHAIELAAARQSSAATSTSAAAGPSKGLSTAVLNVLSFAPNLLNTMWHWLAVNAALPLEAPLQASRGLDITALSAGPDSLPKHAVLVLGVFSRSLAQLLLVLDDVDLHQHQAPFTLATSRAIACTFNSLVFHTHFPECHPKTRQSHHPPVSQAQEIAVQPISVETVGHGRALLAQYVPICLRELFDRDARRRFCQPNLWTEPFNNLMATLAAQHQHKDGTLAMTAAVVQALLTGFGLATDDGQAASSGSHVTPASATGAAAAAPGATAAAPGATAAAPAGVGVPGLRTSALLALLRAAPQCVPFPVRLELFRQMLQQDKVSGRWQLSPFEGGPRPVKVTIHRTSLLDDAFRALAGAGSHIKSRLMVTFVNAQGLEEAGVDHGGLMKELLEQAVAAGTQPEYGLFATTEGSVLMYPNPAAQAIPQGLALLEFVGMLVGKALYEGILLDLSFAPFFLRSLQGGRPGLDDLAGLDRTLHASCLAIKSCPPDQVEHLGLTFIAEQQLFGKTIQAELLAGGDSLPVTADNRLLYIHLLADWHLNARLGRAASAFAAGLSIVLAPSWLRLFSPDELNQLISGGRGSGLDIADMARHAQYSNGYTCSSSTVKMFWKVVAELTPDEQAALLRFITSTSRAPLGGFKHLQPPLTIHKVDCGPAPLAFVGGKDVDRLPSASTCYNMLKLPNYKRASTMKQKLLYAIRDCKGFELS